ncbi:MAG: sugar-binding transcriptional regulator, partial [Mesorhizobium sp.]
LVDHEVNRRVCAYPLQDLSDIPAIILVSGGQEKIAIMRAALANTNVSVLITDEDAAKGLLNR